MKKYLFIIAAAATVLTACTKELKEVSKEAIDDDAKALTYIGAVSDEVIAGKALVNDETAAFTWSTGDQIAVFSGGTYYVSEELSSSYNGQATAQFAFADDIDAGRTDFAVYPASLVHNGFSAITSSVNKHTAAEFSVKLPKNYELEQLQGEQSPAPRIAVNVPGQGLQFKSICALLRITLKDVPKGCDHLTVQFPDKKVNGEYVMTGVEAGTSALVLAGSSKESESIITINELGLKGYADSLVLNIPVPTDVSNTLGYANVKVTAWDADDVEINHIVAPIKVVSSVSTSWGPGRKTARKMTAYLPAFTVAGSRIDTATAKVIFAPGNLRAKVDVVPKVTIKSGARSNSCSIDNFGSASEWSFHEHQYDSYRNTIPAGHTYAQNSFEEFATGDYTDLFAWTGADAGSTLKNKGLAYLFGVFYGASSGTSGYLGGASGSPNVDLLHDWGENVILHGEVTYPANTWRTPSASEWECVLKNRKDASDALIKNGVKATLIRAAGDTVAYGLILFPDHYVHPYGVPAFVKEYCAANPSYDGKTTGAMASDNVFNLDDWARLENAGCVFLPTTDQRNYNADITLMVNNPGCGLYWSSTLSATSLAFALAFNCPEAGRNVAYPGSGSTAIDVDVKYKRSRYYSLGVRLVRDIK